MRVLVIATCLVLLCGYAGYSTGKASEPLGGAAARAERGPTAHGPREHTLCAGAMPPAVDFDIVADRTTGTGQGERLDVSVVAVRPQGRNADLVYGLELRNDLGQRMMNNRISPALSLTSDAPTLRDGHALPVLPDGYYFAKATGVVTDSSGEEINQLAVLYFAVAGRKISLIDSDTYYARSRANLGVSP